MTGETYVEQLALMRATPEAELDYYGIATFGRREVIDP